MRGLSLVAALAATTARRLVDISIGSSVPRVSVAAVVVPAIVRVVVIVGVVPGVPKSQNLITLAGSPQMAPRIYGEEEMSYSPVGVMVGIGVGGAGVVVLDPIAITLFRYM